MASVMAWASSAQTWGPAAMKSGSQAGRLIWMESGAGGFGIILKGLRLGK
jgi:hypothetical protein